MTIYLDYNNPEKLSVPVLSSVISFDNEIVSAELTDGFLYIKGIKEGSTIVQTESKIAAKKEILVTVKYALLNKIWIFISSDLDSIDPAIKRMVEEDAKTAFDF